MLCTDCVVQICLVSAAEEEMERDFVSQSCSPVLQGKIQNLLGLNEKIKSEPSLAHQLGKVRTFVVYTHPRFVPQKVPSEGDWFRGIILA